MTVWQVVGWIGNAAFFSRFLVQWFLSERAGRSVAPRSFWWLSLTGSALLSAYSIDRGQPILLAGLLVNSCIYARNLFLSYRGGRAGGLGSLASTLIAIVVTAFLFGTGTLRETRGWASSTFWLVGSIVGQSLWSSRFVVQWWFSERRGYSHFPRVFWWLSLGGNGLLLAYALHLADPVYVAGFLPGPIVQVRNLMLGRKRPPPAQAARGSEPPGADRTLRCAQPSAPAVHSELG